MPIPTPPPPSGGDILQHLFFFIFNIFSEERAFMPSMPKHEIKKSQVYITQVNRIQ